MIDGETQTGADCGNSIASRALKIVLNGSGASISSGLSLERDSDGSTIRGVVINQWPYSGINMGFSGSHVVECSYIGTDVTGTQDLGNGHYGVTASLSPGNNRIGTNGDGVADLTEGNLLSGNSISGVALDGSNNIIAGNYIGVDATGTVRLGNDGRGVAIGESNNRVGTNGDGVSDVVERNIISGNGNDSGIIVGGSNNILAGNYIGTDVSGTVALGNDGHGIWVHSCANCIIGTDSDGIADEVERNIISGNGASGISLSFSITESNIIAGNYIGTDVTGTISMSNGNHGVFLWSGAQNNVIGGTATGAGNIISGNAERGVYLRDAGTAGNLIQGNVIGTNVTGIVALGNDEGVRLSMNANSNVVEDNIIAGNSLDGLVLAGPDNVIQGNYIGTDDTGTINLGNGRDGIRFGGGTENNTIGGTAASEGNTIAFNAGIGLSFLPSAGTGNAIRSNSIFENDGLGIDLGGDGPTPNDPGDADSSPNNLQNFPDIDDAFLVGNDLYVAYRVDSDPANATYPITIEVFEADANDEEGETLLGRDTFSVNDFNSGPNKLVNLGNAPGLNAGDFVVSTATDADDNTSEFSFGAFQVGSANFAVRLKRAVVTTRGVGKAVVKWQSADVSKNKVGIYVDGVFQKNTRNDNKVKVKFNNPNNGPFDIYLCEKNSTVCSNTVVADFTDAVIIGPDDPDFYDDDDDTYAGKGAGTEAAPSAFTLQGNYPNPFNPTTSIRIDLPERAAVSVAVYDLLGRQVLALPAQVLEAGAARHIAVDGSSLASGTYLYRLTAQMESARHVATGRMTLVK